MLELLIIIAVLAVDQFTKQLTEVHLALGESIPVWEGVFAFANVHNTGAAWGMFAGGRWVFIIITIITCGFMIYMLFRFHNVLGIVARVCLALLFAGAIGNLIDRIWLGYVRDMLYFSLINFPVFNVADSAVCIGAGLLVLDTLFVKKGSLFEVMEPWLENKKDGDNPKAPYDCTGDIEDAELKETMSTEKDIPAEITETEKPE